MTKSVDLTEEYVACETLKWHGERIEPGELVRPRYKTANYGALERAGKILRVAVMAKEDFDALLDRSYHEDGLPQDLSVLSRDQLIAQLKKRGVDPAQDIEGEGAQGYIKKSQLLEALRDIRT